MAAIIVSYPIFSFVFLRLTKRTILNPGLRNLKSRKVLIYLTLILTFMMILWSFQVTIFALISGGIELNTILWFTTGLIINGSIFAYYLFQINKKLSLFLHFTTPSLNHFAALSYVPSTKSSS